MKALSRSLWLIVLLCACEGIYGFEGEIDDIVESEIDYLDDVAPDEDGELESRAAINISNDVAAKIAAAAPKDAAGLPLWESRPGAKVALYLDFDGGSYKGEQYFRGIDLDGNRSRFGTQEQTAIIRAALEVAEGYKGFNINVTTSDAARKKSEKWGWILITDDESTSGRSRVGVIGQKTVPQGWAGSKAVFSPPSAQRGYILIHELGHQFGLNHSGLYKNGKFYEWSELKQSRTADWMGGRSSYFYDFKWEKSQTEYSTSWQDPVKVIGSIAGFVNDDNGVASTGHRSNTLLPGGELTINQYLGSKNDSHRLYLQSDGNLVLRRMSDKKSRWSSGTHGKSATRLKFQSDGNLVLRTASGAAVWSSKTAGSGATKLYLHSAGQLVLYRDSKAVWSVNGTASEPDDKPDEPSGTDGKITHIGTNSIWDGDGQNIKIARPSGSKAGDLLVLILHRTDDDLPLYVNGWTRVAECYKRDNVYACSTEANCKSWHNDDFCGDFGGHGGHDLAQSIFYRKASSSEPSSYTFNLNRDSSGHPGWIILSALRGAATSNPVRDWAHMGCDGSSRSVFPSVYGVAGDMVLLSQSFDDSVARSKFGAPNGTTTFGYVSNSDEAGFLFGGTLNKTGETGKMTTTGDGASSCKDALVSLTIKPQ